MPTPAFQPDAVYSSAGNFFGNFPREAADATTRLPTTFKTSGPAVGSQATDNFGGAGNGLMGVLGGFIGSSPMDPAEARPATYPQLRRVSSAFPNVTRGPEQPVTPPESAPCWGYSAASRYCRFRVRYGVCRIDPAHLLAAPCSIFWLALAGEIQRSFCRMAIHADLIATSVGGPGSSKASARRRIGGCLPTGQNFIATFQHI
jgi:hypothetical protein